jgi:hypothetical protein
LPAASFSRGARFRVLQAGQATIRVSVMANLADDLEECGEGDDVAPSFHGGGRIWMS